MFTGMTLVASKGDTLEILFASGRSIDLYKMHLCFHDVLVYETN